MWLQFGYSYLNTIDTAPAPRYNGGTVKERQAPAESGADYRRPIARTLKSE